MMDSHRSSDIQATERIFRKIVHPGLDSLRLLDKNGIPLPSPIGSLKKKSFILSPRGVPTRVTNHVYSGRNTQIARPFSEGLTHSETPEYYQENSYSSASYGPTQSANGFVSRNYTFHGKSGRNMKKSMSASTGRYLSSAPDSQRYLQSAGTPKSSQWNNSHQGLRLEKEWDDLAKSRSLKRNSEIVSHRVDRMYFMTGHSLNLKPKYQVDEEELNRLRELSRSRQSSKRQNRNKKHKEKGDLHLQLEKELKTLSMKEKEGQVKENDGDKRSVKDNSEIEDHMTTSSHQNGRKSPLEGWALTENNQEEELSDKKDSIRKQSLHEEALTNETEKADGTENNENNDNEEETVNVNTLNDTVNINIADDTVNINTADNTVNINTADDEQNVDHLTDDGFHENFDDTEMKGRADGRQGTEDVKSDRVSETDHTADDMQEG